MAEVNRVVEDRLNELAQLPDQHQVNGAKELVQELALFALSRAGFFKQAAFTGGTALRILYGLRRFSEDLDFSTTTAKQFSLDALVEPTLAELRAWGLDAEFTVRSSDSAVVVGWVKESSIGGLLQLHSPLHAQQKLHVKIEVDTNPPAGTKLEQRQHRFPIAHMVTTYDLPSLFAGKLHALLCRPYMKGRDWYDFFFYLDRDIGPNKELLTAALAQTGPYKDSLPPLVTAEWVQAALEERIAVMSVDDIVRDVQPFLKDSRDIELWSQNYFTERISELRD